MRKSQRKLLLRFDRILSHDLLKQVLMLVGILAVVFIVALVVLTLSGDDWKTYCSNKHISPLAFPFYLLIDSNAFSALYSTDLVSLSGITIFWACIIYVLGVIIFTGMLISVMTNMIEQRVKKHQSGQIHYLKSGHYVIMGYDELVPAFISSIFRTDADAYVLILTSAKVENVREKLRKSFPQHQMAHIVINYGHRTSSEFYRDIHLEAAESVYIVGYLSDTAHDAINVECVDCIYNYLNTPDVRQRPRRITCVFRDIDTYAAFKTTDIFSRIEQIGVEFIPYNLFAGWAQQVFVNRAYHDKEAPDRLMRYPAVYGQGVTPDDRKPVHLVFVGTTNFAVAFANEAAHVLHFPNFKKDGDPRTRITFIDINADKEKDEFITRNRHFFEVQSYSYRDMSYQDDGASQPSAVTSCRISPMRFHGADADFLDVEFEFIKGDVFSPQVQNLICEWAGDHGHGRYLSIFLALRDQRQNFVMGMNMPDEVYDNSIPLFIRQDRSDNFVTELRDADASRQYDYKYYDAQTGRIRTQKRTLRYANIYPFGMNETGFCEDEQSLRRAKLINYLYATADYTVNKFRPVLALDAMPEADIWAEAEARWRPLSVALKWSNLYAAYAIPAKLDSLRAMRGLSLSDSSRDQQPLSEYEVEQLSPVEHNRWNVEKLLMGYRKPLAHEDQYVHGADLGKNKNLFIHHDIRPFGQLGSVDELDREFTRYIPWIVKMTGSPC